jgi:hypothetical protein
MTKSASTCAEAYRQSPPRALANSSSIRYAFRFVVQRLLMSAAICVTIGVGIWILVPSDQPLPVPPVARAARPDLQRSATRRLDSRRNSPAPSKAATIFVALAAQLRGGDHAELEIDGEDGWSFHEARLNHLDPRRIPAGVPLFIRISYSGTTWGERAEPRSFGCGSILTFAVNRRYNLWCGEKDDVVMTLLEETQ